MNIEIERWNTELSNQPKLRFYRLFKSEYLTEPYILKCRNKSTRSFIAQIRAGALPLQVEVGRFIQQALQDRICQHCKSLEDELHFIFYCPLYLQLRIEFYNQVSKQGRIQGGAPGARVPPKFFQGKKNRGQPFWNHLNILA